VQVHLVEIRDNKISIQSLANYIISEGKVTGFDFHPSKDYILITSSRGKIFMFRIDTGELRGTIKIPLHASGCLIDPSGLYVVIQVPPYSPTHIKNFDEQQFGNRG